MSITNRTPGAKIMVGKGRAGERPDFYPAKVSGPTETIVDNGRIIRSTPYVSFQQNLKGEWFLTTGEINPVGRYAFDRFDTVEELDGSASAPKSLQDLLKEAAASAMAFMQSLPESGQSVAADDLVVE